jgi:hypothetical protein
VSRPRWQNWHHQSLKKYWLCKFCVTGRENQTAWPENKFLAVRPFSGCATAVQSHTLWRVVILPGNETGHQENIQTSSKFSYKYIQQRQNPHSAFDNFSQDNCYKMMIACDLFYNIKVFKFRMFCHVYIPTLPSQWFLTPAKTTCINHCSTWRKFDVLSKEGAVIVSTWNAHRGHHWRQAQE